MATPREAHIPLPQHRTDRGGRRQKSGTEGRERDRGLDGSNRLPSPAPSARFGDSIEGGRAQDCYSVLWLPWTPVAWLYPPALVGSSKYTCIVKFFGAKFFGIPWNAQEYPQRRHCPKIPQSSRPTSRSTCATYWISRKAPGCTPDHPDCPGPQAHLD